MKSDKILQGENKYRNDENYYNEYHRNKLRKINKFLMKMLHALKISCLIGTVSIFYLTIEWNYELILIIDELSMIYHGAFLITLEEHIPLKDYL